MSQNVKIEAGQITNPESFPMPNELVCIQVLKVFDQVSVRDCVTKTIELKCLRDSEHSDCCEDKWIFEGVDDFDIKEVKVISKSDSLSRPGFKKIKLLVIIKFKVHLRKKGHSKDIECEAAFNITINEIYCPDCFTQIGVIRYPKEHNDKTIDLDGTFIKVEAIAEAFNDAIKDDDLTFDIGAFFIVKCECFVQLLIPAYGYCPVPPEQQNPATLNCNIFNDRTRIPFPTQFFPDQKWNPLDRC